MTKPWNSYDKKLWFDKQKIQRSYKKDVLEQIDLFKNEFDVELYGKLSLNENKYPIYAIKSKDFDKNKKNVLITGGVHGYETSGIHGVLEFIRTYAKDYLDFNLFMIPCLSPWAYETINRWNNKTIDPNRSFYENSNCEESMYLMNFLKNLDLEFYLHVDLHETTNSDNSIFRPALALRDDKIVDDWEIPDGFYLVGDVNQPNDKMQEKIIQEVEKVTHIAPSDKDGRIIGEKTSSFGVINYETKALGLCAGVTGAKFCTTTEVYPDSKNANPQICIDAQVVVIKTALEYIRAI
ncbi:MAG: M14 family metallocarboxypeptidase [Campylobacteraceae bacterium]|nr:M14 family metallocarboxypeptidase [Campylobacteraceae bacterium]